MGLWCGLQTLGPGLALGAWRGPGERLVKGCIGDSKQELPSGVKVVEGEGERRLLGAHSGLGTGALCPTLGKRGSVSTTPLEKGVWEFHI